MRLAMYTFARGNKTSISTTTVTVTNVNTNTNTTTNSSTSSHTGVGPATMATAAKVAFKKPVHFVNSIATSTNGQFVILPSSGATTAAGNQRIAILRRPNINNIQIIPRPTTIDPNNTYSVVPTIHRVRTRTLSKQNLPKLLETDRLIESLKSIIRPQKISQQDYCTTKKVLSVYQSLVKAANQSNHNLNTSTSGKRSKSHSSLSNHKSGGNPVTTTPSSLITSSQKQNGHHGNSNGSIGITSDISNYISSNNNTNHIDKRTQLRVADANHK